MEVLDVLRLFELLIMDSTGLSTVVFYCILVDLLGADKVATVNGTF